MIAFFCALIFLVEVSDFLYIPGRSLKLRPVRVHFPIDLIKYQPTVNLSTVIQSAISSASRQLSICKSFALDRLFNVPVFT
jgi:hypothetical protein